MKTLILQITPPINTSYGSPFNLSTNSSGTGAVIPSTATTAELEAGISVQVEDNASEIVVESNTGLCPAYITVPIIYPCYCTELINLLGTSQTFNYTDCSNNLVEDYLIEANDRIRICGILSSSFSVDYPDIEIVSIDEQCVKEPSKPISCGNKPSICYRIYRSPTATTTSYSCWSNNIYFDNIPLSVNAVNELCIETGTLVSGDLTVQVLSTGCDNESCNYYNYCHTITATGGNLVYEYIQGDEKFISNTLLSGATAKICAKVGTIIKTSGTGTLNVVNKNYTCNTNGLCETSNGCLTVTHTDVRTPHANYYVGVNYTDDITNLGISTVLYFGQYITACVRPGTLTIYPTNSCAYTTVVHNENCALASQCEAPPSYCYTIDVISTSTVQWKNSLGQTINRTLSISESGTFTCMQFNSFVLISGNATVYTDGYPCSDILTTDCTNALP